MSAGGQTGGNAYPQSANAMTGAGGMGNQANAMTGAGGMGNQAGGTPTQTLAYASQFLQQPQANAMTGAGGTPTQTLAYASQFLRQPQPPQGALASQPAAPATAPATGQPNAYQQAADYLSSAGSRTQTEMGFQPMNVAGSGYTAATAEGAAPITAQNVSAGQIATTNLGSYMNPYTQNVINTSLSDLDRQRAMTQQQNSASAAAAGAFGGSRQGLVEAETNRAFADAAARTTAGLQQQGFLNAQQMAGQDIGANLQAQLANQSAGLTAQQQTAANLLNTQFANQGALNTAGQFGAQQSLQAQLANQNAGLAGSQQRLAAAGQLGNLGTTGFNMANTLQQQQFQQGLLQQQMEQQRLTDAMNQFYGFANSPLNYAQLMQNTIGGSPLVNNQTRTSQYQPGIMEILGSGLKMIPFLP